MSKTVGQLVAESEGLAQFRKGARSSGQIEVGSFKVSPILSGTWTSPPDFLNRVAAPPMPTLPLRSLLPAFQTASNMIEYPKETGATNAANYQAVEGVDKPQSDLSFTLVQVAISTLATWIAASRQAMDDSPFCKTTSTADGCTSSSKNARAKFCSATVRADIFAEFAHRHRAQPGRRPT